MVMLTSIIKTHIKDIKTNYNLYYLSHIASYHLQILCIFTLYFYNIICIPIMASTLQLSIKSTLQNVKCNT